MKSTIQGVLIAVAVATLGAGAVGTACAQTSSSSPNATPPPHHWHHGHFRGLGGSPFLGTLLRATRQLTGTNALSGMQQMQIKNLLQGARSAHQPGAQPQGVGIAVIGNPGSSSYPTAISDAITAATNRITTESTLATEIYNTVLTGAQQGQVATVLQSMQAKQQARRAAWAAKHASNG